MQPSNVYPLARGNPSPTQSTGSGPVPPQVPPSVAVASGPAVSGWTPLLDNADPSSKSRWGWAVLLVAAAVIVGGHALETLTTGQPAALVGIGLGRIVLAAREWPAPALRPFVALISGIEHLLAAGVLLWLSIMVLRKVPVPRPSQNELLIVATRQLRMFRIDVALLGLLCLAIGAALAAHDGPAEAWRRIPIIQQVPVGLLTFIAGLVEFYGLQRVIWAAITYSVPAARAYLCIIADPMHHGMNNRLCFGDGRFGGKGQRVVYHEDVHSVKHVITGFRGRVLGLSDLVLTFVDNGAISTVSIRAPASITNTQQIVDILSGIWRAAVPRPKTGIVNTMNHQR